MKHLADLIGTTSGQVYNLLIQIPPHTQFSHSSAAHETDPLQLASDQSATNEFRIGEINYRQERGSVWSSILRQIFTQAE